MTAKPDDAAARPETIIHGTLIKVNGQGILLTGPSGSGKSDLALRLMTQAFNPAFCPAAPILVADDQVVLTLENDTVCGRPPAPLEGLIEVRHLGIKAVPFCLATPIHLIVTLTPGKEPERMPARGGTKELISGHPLPAITLDPLEPSAPAKIILATGFDAK